MDMRGSAGVGGFSGVQGRWGSNTKVNISGRAGVGNLAVMLRVHQFGFQTFSIFRMTVSMYLLEHSVVVLAHVTRTIDVNLEGHSSLELGKEAGSLCVGSTWRSKSQV